MKKYHSKYTDKLITSAQYLAEIMCERLAKKEKKELCLQFWNTDYWILPFKNQLRFANQLLKIYSCEAIINALNTFQGKRIYSLTAKWLDPIIKDEQLKIDNKPKTKTEATYEIKEEFSITRTPFKKGKSELDKLD